MRGALPPGQVQGGHRQGLQQSQLRVRERKKKRTTRGFPENEKKNQLSLLFAVARSFEAAQT